VAGESTDVYLLDRLVKDYDQVYFVTDGEFNKNIDYRVKVICLGQGNLPSEFRR